MDLPEIPQQEGPPGDKRYGWYHITFHTYGAWLPGDPRGWRTRKHRQHVDGDYKNPPKEKQPRLHRHCKQSLKHAPIVIPADLRRVVGHAIIARFVELGVFVLRVSVSGTHVHVQAKLLRGKARALAGVVKNHAWHSLRKTGWKLKLWAKRSRATVIANRSHQENVFHYIGRHVNEGAWIWTWKRKQDAVTDAKESHAKSMKKSKEE